MESRVLGVNFINGWVEKRLTRAFFQETGVSWASVFIMQGSVIFTLIAPLLCVPQFPVTLLHVSMESTAWACRRAESQFGMFLSLCFFHFLFRTSTIDVRRWLKCEKERCSERQKKLCRAATVAHQEHPRGGSMELATVSVLQRSCWVGVIVGWWETANESPIPIVFSSFCSVSQRVSALYREASYNNILSWRRPRPRHWYAFQQSLAAMEQMYTCALSL